ncbi:MAG TPA: MinD/ParA family protein [Pseudogracilibacillus sp.]|nr:MinD/ParA family protein [Pseudogracilibacillus sp.]
MHDQAERLRNRMNGHVEENNCKTIAVISGKGGVGKSTTVLNFAIEMQNKGKRVLIFDLDIGMGNIDILLGQPSKYTILNFLEEFLPIHDMIETGPKGLSYIAGGSGFNDLLELDEAKLNYFFSQYELLTKDYDYIFFDLGAGVSKSSLAFILASDECFLVTTPEPTSIADAYSMIKHIVKSDPQLPIVVWMNRSETVREGELMLDKFANVAKEFLNKDIIKLGVLPYDPIVTRAVSRQTPYVILKENASVSKAMRQNVERYLSLNETNYEAEQTTFIQRLKKFLLVR